MADFVLFEKLDKYAKITLNRPKRLNSMVQKMYLQISEHLQSTVDDESIKLVVITGVGKYFTGGADLTEMLSVEREAEPNFDHFKNFVKCLINFPKPILAVVNGPAVGVGVTMLPHCDVVYASSSATFTTPFSKIGISPEACSSHMFPAIMGIGKASEMLLFNKMMTAEEASAAGLVTQVFPPDRLHVEVDKRIKEMVDLPLKSLLYGKELMRSHHRAALLQKNDEECARLVQRFTSNDIVIQFAKFMREKQAKKQKKSKL